MTEEDSMFWVFWGILTETGPGLNDMEINRKANTVFPYPCWFSVVDFYIFIVLYLPNHAIQYQQKVTMDTKRRMYQSFLTLLCYFKKNMLKICCNYLDFVLFVLMENVKTPSIGPLKKQLTEIPNLNSLILVTNDTFTFYI